MSNKKVEHLKIKIWVFEFEFKNPSLYSIILLLIIMVGCYLFFI